MRVEEQGQEVVGQGVQAAQTRLGVAMLVDEVVAQSQVMMFDTPTAVPVGPHLIAYNKQIYFSYYFKNMKVKKY